MHAIDFINEHYRFKRFLSLEKLRSQLKREKGHCTWCNKPCSRRWCSNECRDDGYVRAGFILGPVERRDKGVCALCGLDTRAIRQRVKDVWNRAKGEWEWNQYGPKQLRPHTFARIRRFARRTGYHPNRTPYDIDHIVPVCEGGGCCGIDNLRTLCFTCHKAETAHLRKRLAAKKNDSQRRLFLTQG